MRRNPKTWRSTYLLLSPSLYGLSRKWDTWKAPDESLPKDSYDHLDPATLMILKEKDDAAVKRRAKEAVKLKLESDMKIAHKKEAERR